MSQDRLPLLPHELSGVATLRAEILIKIMERAQARYPNPDGQTMYWRVKPAYFAAGYYAKEFLALGVVFEEAPPRNDYRFECGWIFPDGFHDCLLYIPESGS